jgi:hypothetical protein
MYDFKNTDFQEKKFQVTMEIRFAGWQIYASRKTGMWLQVYSRP